MERIFKWLFALIFVVIVVGAGFIFIVKEGTCAIVSRFGRIANVHTEAGFHFKLPWPIDRIITFDTRSQYMDSGYNETLTNDKINIILQTYLVWNISDPARFYTSVGDFDVAQRYLNDLIANVKNGVMGNYTISSLVSMNLEDIKMDEICKAIEERVSLSASDNYGIGVQKLRFKRVTLPDANVQSVFSQMIADRQRLVAQYSAEGERDSTIITSEASARASEIVAQGRFDAAEIDAATEKQVAEIYAEAYDKHMELFVFLKKLIALENSVNPETVVIMRASESPFDIIMSINENEGDVR